MVTGRQSATHFTGSAFVRLLARLADEDLPDPKQGFAETLGRWLGWKEAVSLSAALDAPAARAGGGAVPCASALQRELVRVRTALASAIAEDTAIPVDPWRGGVPRAPTGVADRANDFAPYRLLYVARQEAMQAGIASLRERVRSVLAATASASLAKLAALDAAMEQTLGARERALLATVPALLARRFERLHATRRDSASDSARHDSVSDPAPAPGPHAARRDAAGGGAAAWHSDMQAVLLAELALRLQPVEGLLAALRDEAAVQTA